LGNLNSLLKLKICFIVQALLTDYYLLKTSATEAGLIPKFVSRKLIQER